MTADSTASGNVPPGRASRTSGRQTRTALFKAATALFLEHGGDEVPVSRICTAAGAHPNQVTYYFGSKDRLFVEVACSAVLRAGKQAEIAASEANTVGEYTRALIFTLLGPEAAGVKLFVEAMLLAGRRDGLADLITRALDDLHAAGENALIHTLTRTGWQLRTSADSEARAFWSAIFGLITQKSATGPSFDNELEDAVSIIFNNLQIPEPVLRTTLDHSI